MDATESFQLQNLYQTFCFGLTQISCVHTAEKLLGKTCLQFCTLFFSPVDHGPRLGHKTHDVNLIQCWKLPLYELFRYMKIQDFFC